TLSLTGTALARVVVTAPQNEALLLQFCWTAVAADVVYLAVCPHEEPRCPRPAVPADCQPPGGAYEWSRTCETHAFRILCELPPSHRDPGLSCETLDEIVCGRAHV